MMTAHDITLMVTPDGLGWGKFVSDSLKKFTTVSHTTLVLDEQQVGHGNSTEVAFACQNSVVMLLVVTPELVDFLRHQTSWFPGVLRQMPATSSLVAFSLLDEDSSSDLTDATKDHYLTHGWTFLDPGYDVKEVNQTIAKVLDMVEKCRSAKDTEMKKEETRVKSAKKKLLFFPSTIYECGSQVAMVFNKEIEGNVSLKFEEMDIHVIAHRENEKVFTFSAPQLLPGKYHVLVKVNEKTYCHSCLMMRGLDMATFTSPHYLMQILGLNNLQELDVHLKNVFGNSLPSDRSLKSVFQSLPEPDPQEQQKNLEEQYPTLLHFAAAYGLSEFCAALLECPGSRRAFTMRNCDGQDPYELALYNGFEELGHYMDDFMEVQSTNDIYENYINMQGSKHTEPHEELYDDPIQVLAPKQLPRRHSESAIPVDTAPPPPPRKCTSESGQDDITQSSAGNPDRPPLPLPRSRGAQRDIARSVSERTVSTPSSLQTIKESEKKASTLPAGTQATSIESIVSREPLQKGAIGSRSLSELIELNEMVKSNEINLKEAQMFFNAWNNRHGRDTAASFKERQKELADIKEEYMEVREKMTKHDKSSKSLFSRFRTGGKHTKSTIKVNISDPVLQRQKQTPKVFSKSPSASQLCLPSSNRDSSASSASSSCSSRDSAWSQGSRASSFSTADDSEKDEGVGQEDCTRRRKESSGSDRNRQSLGHMYLQQTEQEGAENHNNLPPPLPPRTHSQMSQARRA